MTADFDVAAAVTGGRNICGVCRWRRRQLQLNQDCTKRGCQFGFRACDLPRKLRQMNHRRWIAHDITEKREKIHALFFNIEKHTWRH
jgi:hypothetical protein